MWKSNFHGTFVLNRRVDLHAIDATRARWRGDAGGTAASSSRNDLVKNYRVHHTANDLEPGSASTVARAAWWKAPSLLCKFSSRATSPMTWYSGRVATRRPPLTCVEINQCVGCTRQFFTKSFLGDDAAVLARSSGEEPSSRRRVDGVEDDAMIQHERAVKF